MSKEKPAEYPYIKRRTGHIIDLPQHVVQAPHLTGHRAGRQETGRIFRPEKRAKCQPFPPRFLVLVLLQAPAASSPTNQQSSQATKEKDEAGAAASRHTDTQQSIAAAVQRHGGRRRRSKARRESLAPRTAYVYVTS